MGIYCRSVMHAMRIVFLSYNYSPDIHSPEAWIERIRFYSGWLECLAGEHTIIRVDQIDYEGSFTHKGVQYYFVNDGKAKNYFPRKLHRFVKKLAPDIVLVSSFQFPLQLLQLRHCLGRKVKILVQHHAEQPYNGLKKYMQRFAAGKADAWLFAAAETGAAWTEKGNLPRKNKIQELMEVSSVFIPVAPGIAKAVTHVSGAPVFLWVGRLNQNKDPLTAVAAFLDCCLLHPAARLYMIYSSTEMLPQIKQLLADRQGTEQVLLAGKMAHAALQNWYSSADFFLSASHYEGSGTALCEAMSCGCTPVVTGIPSFKKITNNGQYGFLYPPGDVKALTLALSKAAAGHPAGNRQSIIDHFRRELSFESIAAQFLRIAGQL